MTLQSLKEQGMSRTVMVSFNIMDSVRIVRVVPPWNYSPAQKAETRSSRMAQPGQHSERARVSVVCSVLPVVLFLNKERRKYTPTLSMTVTKVTSFLG